MSFQTCKTFVHLQNTDERYFLWNPRAFWPCIDGNATGMFKAQKCSKDFVNITEEKKWLNKVITTVIFMKLREYFVCEEN